MTELQNQERPSAVLVLNSGSSSIKFALMEVPSGRIRLSGLAERLGAGDAILKIQHPDTDAHPATIQLAPIRLAQDDHGHAVEAILNALREQGVGADQLLGVGHRVVHGGERFKASALITPDVLAQIEACSQLAPLHNPANLLGIQVIHKLDPQLPQVAVFDTAFHQSLPRHAYLYALPYALYEEQGIRRYGFHGTSHGYVAEQAAQRLGQPLHKLQLITAHLGNGCSATAVRHGHSVDTTMGLTPLEGLVMGTRSGDLDPGIIFHLADHAGYDVPRLNRLLNRESGLLGLSGLSNDMRTLQQAADQGHERARLAIDIFCYRLAKSIGALAMALDRIDALVFTGGIGEHATPVRAQVLNQLGLLGFRLDAERNAQHGRLSGGLITQDDSTQALVIPTNEELKIALDTAQLIQDFQEDRHG